MLPFSVEIQTSKQQLLEFQAWPHVKIHNVIWFGPSGQHYLSSLTSWRKNTSVAMVADFIEKKWKEHPPKSSCEVPPQTLTRMVLFCAQGSRFFNVPHNSQDQGRRSRAPTQRPSAWLQSHFPLWRWKVPIPGITNPFHHGIPSPRGLRIFKNHFTKFAWYLVKK